ncbi:sugar-binding transcriptional regulator [Qingshengfaniella alkalisoli]|uniref:Sugar-binding transcriptional regulator n=1 Tax=Qingshengfaniella alkalisoli TaxID=2599296 RepID=A0A5B8J9W6_9RHOB|nr:sugar-binding transcriptional regulator [Qingshengfaniella alkalisoli]QDY71107.1 sugar-binding transcriptional regulator [Qingshengfaniella alkalisoli]
MQGKAKRLDDAARAGWLYYIAGNTQDEIASKLGVSRQSAQRLVAQAMQSGMVKVRIDHPIANCLSLARELVDRFDLEDSEVVPTDPASDDATLGVAEATADDMESWLSRPEPITMALGTGRTLRAAVACLPHLDCAQHRIVSLTGNISPDGSTAHYNVIFSVADIVSARTFPVPLPVIASSPEERDMLQSQPMVRATFRLAQDADVAFIGIGEMGPNAPLVKDGFITVQDANDLCASGVVGEILGWVFDEKGAFIQGATNLRVASAPVPSPNRSKVIAVAKGNQKISAIRAALKGNLVSKLITDEATALALLK